MSVSSGLTIPAVIEGALLITRQSISDLAAYAKPDSDRETGFAIGPKPLDKELVFWEMADDNELRAFLFEDLLPSLLGNESIDFSLLPEGYRPLVEVLYFERERSVFGWKEVLRWGSSLDKESEDVDDLVKCYRHVNLFDESDALAEVQRVFRHIPEFDEDAKDIEQLDREVRKAYLSIPNQTPEIEDRIAVMLAFVRGHPRQFGETGANRRGSQSRS